ncbi:hypothetical protein [Flavobacterium sp. 3HN19-14]|uniref:hypothetical protein n=1 Tax=Flavobacterium sp. 3HN19-14 TaxID=3448133 RepID=UPI003EE3C820
MKKLFITAAFLAFSGIALAQQDGSVHQDQIQQQPPRETQQQIENAAQRTAAQKKAESEFQAEKRAKDKGSTQKVTTAERHVSDSIKPVKQPKPQVQPTPKPRK